MNFMEVTIIILIVVAFMALYAIGIYFNSRTPMPVECESPSSKCKSCSSSSCAYSSREEVSKLKEEIRAKM